VDRLLCNVLAFVDQREADPIRLRTRAATWLDATKVAAIFDVLARRQDSRGGR
jgi:hypothetical protein